MNTQEIFETAAKLIDGAILDSEDIAVEDATIIADLLASQDFALRIKPEFNLVYAVPETYLH